MNELPSGTFNCARCFSFPIKCFVAIVLDRKSRESVTQLLLETFQDNLFCLILLL